MVNLGQARNFVYEHGTLWERALFSYLFDGGSLERLHQCLRVYKNEDNGFGHRFEHDLSFPESNSVALEYLLSTLRRFNVPVGDLLEGTSQWLESCTAEDGTITPPDGLADYPIAPWWREWGGQPAPDSIVGNLAHFGKASSPLLDSTQKWVSSHLTEDDIQQIEWLFMAYHPYDYYTAIEDAPEHDVCLQATYNRLAELAQSMPIEQAYSLFAFVPRPDAPLAKMIPDVVEKALDHLEKTQESEGHWRDQHGLAQWYPMVTIGNLYALKQFGRLQV
ncbi:MAG: hypothetical protein KC708_07510 [Anaerolineae bacterium]|nr:hypothetical protein [Anaerolineae bacterium]